MWLKKKKKQQQPSISYQSQVSILGLVGFGPVRHSDYLYNFIRFIIKYKLPKGVHLMALNALGLPSLASFQRNVSTFLKEKKIKNVFGDKFNQAKNEIFKKHFCQRV